MPDTFPVSGQVICPINKVRISHSDADFIYVNLFSAVALYLNASERDAAGGCAGAEDEDAAGIEADAVKARLYRLLRDKLPENGENLHCDGTLGADVDISVMHRQLHIAVRLHSLRHRRQRNGDLLPDWGGGRQRGRDAAERHHEAYDYESQSLHTSHRAV